MSRINKSKGLIDENCYALPRPPYAQTKAEGKNIKEIGSITTFGTKNVSMVSNVFLKQRPQSFKADNKVLNVAEVVADPRALDSLNTSFYKKDQPNLAEEQASKPPRPQTTKGVRITKPKSTRTRQ